MPMDPAEILEVLACPKCKGGLVQVENAFNCNACGLSYPVREGIPVMLIDEAARFEPPRPRSPK